MEHGVAVMKIHMRRTLLIAMCSTAFSAFAQVHEQASSKTWADDGTTLTPPAGRNVAVGATVLDAIKGIHTVYSARCDGATDDTAAIQNVLNSVGSAGGGTVQLPPGQCNISGKGLNYVNHTYRPLVLRGAGKFRTLLHGVPGTKVVLDLGGSDNSTLEHLTIEGAHADVGLLLCRYSTPGTNGPGGSHTIRDTVVTGTFNVAAAYLVSSEGNKIIASEFRTTSSVPTFYTANTNALHYTSPNGTILVSTNSQNSVISSAFINYGGNAAFVINGSSPAWYIAGSYFYSTTDNIAIMGPAGNYTMGPITMVGNSIENAGKSGAAKLIHIYDTRMYHLYVRNNYFASFDSTGTDIYQDTVTRGGELASSELQYNRHSGHTVDVNLHTVVRSTITAEAAVKIRARLTNSHLASNSQTFDGVGTVTSNEIIKTGYGVLTPAFYQQTMGLPSWRKDSVLLIANGVSGCTNANGCWQVNGFLGPSTVASVIQPIPMPSLGANMWIDAVRLKTSTACGGALKAITIDAIGDSNGSSYYSSSLTYDLKAAVSATNKVDVLLTVVGADTTVSSNLSVRVRTSGANVDQIAAGCAFDVWTRWSNLP